MRYIALLFLLIQSILGYSQFHVGESKEKVISDLKRKNVAFTVDVLDDTTRRISVLDESAYQMIWVLSPKDTVTRQTLIPEGESTVNDFVKWFNMDFVRISDTEWRSYENGRIYKIQLKYILEEPFFSITLSPDSK